MNFVLQDKPILMYDAIFKAIIANEQDTRLLDVNFKFLTTKNLKSKLT